MPTGTSADRIVVVKIGGSVLTSSAAYRTAAQFLTKRIHGCPEEQVVAVVSAQEGLTDTLERVARDIKREPNASTLDLLWYTGELRSVALLMLHLEALGVEATGLNVHQTGLHAWTSHRQNFDVIDGNLAEALRQHRVVVVPGFFAVTREGAIVSLGRGGSDLVAVLLAEALGASGCELVKDVPGYFTEDPHSSRKAEPVPFLTYRQAIAMAKKGCGLVQKEALEVGETAGLSITVRSLADDGPRTVVSATREVMGSSGTEASADTEVSGACFAGE
jgi:aspartate kinase